MADARQPDASKPENVSDKEEHTGLPAGAKIYESSPAQQLLHTAWDMQIRLNEELGVCLQENPEDFAGYTVEVSSDDSDFWEREFHPTVDGHCYYRGYRVTATDGYVLVYTDWLINAQNEAARYPFVATMGNVSDTEIKDILDMYAERTIERIAKERGL